MSFRINKVGAKPRPQGHYIVISSIEYFLEEITVDNSGKVCFKLRDLARGTSMIKKPCDLNHLISLIPKAMLPDAE
jgi:hypothetical protein